MTTPEEAAAVIDRLTGVDPERDHGIADEVLLTVAPPEVRDAYRRLQGRCAWWATA